MARKEMQFGIRLTGDNKGAVNAMRMTDAELAKLRRAMQRTDASARNSRNQMQRWSGSLLSVRRMLAPLAGIAGVSLLVRTTRNVIQQTAALSEAADQAGITAERYQELTKAFGDLGGITEQQVSGSLLRFNRRLGLAAEGAGPAKSSFDDLRVAMRNAAGEMRATDDVLADVMRSLAGIENDALRAARASQFFGDRTGPQLAAVLGQGQEALDAQIRSLREHGRILEEDTVVAARAANDELNKMRDIVGTRMTQLILDNSDSYMQLAEALASVASFGLKAAAGLGFLLGGMPPGTSGVIDQLDDVQQRLDRVRDRLQSIDPSRQPGLFADLSELERQLDQRAQELETRLLGDSGFAPLEVTVTGRRSTVATDEDSVGASPRVDSSDKLDAQLRRLENRLDPVTAATRTYMEEVSILDDAWREGLISGERFWELLNSLASGDTQEEIGNLADQMDGVTDSVNAVSLAARDMGFVFASAFEDAIVSGGRLSEVLQGLLQDILRIVTRVGITGPLADALGSSLGGMFGGGFSSQGATPSSVGTPSMIPAFASGTLSAPGGTALVGERGPELVNLPRGSQVIPNHALGASVQVNVINNVGAEVQTQSRDDGRGGIALDVMIDQAVGQKISTPGSATNKALRNTFGARGTLAQR